MLNKHIVEAIQRTVDEDLGNAVIVTATHTDARQVMKQLENDLSGIAKACRTNGQEELEIDNGKWVKIISISGYGRGLSADLLVMPMSSTQEQRDELAPIIATGSHILGYL